MIQVCRSFMDMSRKEEERNGAVNIEKLSGINLE